MGNRLMWRAASACAVVLALSIAASARGEWGTYQGDPAHDGHVAATISPAADRILWTAVLPSGSLTDLAVGGGQVYVSSDTYFGSSATQPNVFGLNEQTGSIVWSQATGTNFSVNAPAYANGSVFVQTDEEVTGTYVWGFNASNGSQRFRTPLDAQWEHYLAPTVVGGNLYMDGGHFGGMYSVSAATGTQNWFGAVPQYDGWTPAVAGIYCYAFTGSGGTEPITGKFTILNRTTGTTVSVTTDNGFQWNGYTMDEAPALGSRNDAFVTNGGRLLEFGTSASGGLLSTLTDQYAGQPTVADGSVYVEDGTSSVFSLDESNQNRRWTWSPADGSPVEWNLIASDNLLFASTAQDVYAIDEATGHTVWSLPVSGRLALSDDTLFVSSATGDTVTAIAVPEPTTAGVAMMAVATVLARRRARRLR